MNSFSAYARYEVALEVLSLEIGQLTLAIAKARQAPATPEQVQKLLAKRAQLSLQQNLLAANDHAQIEAILHNYQSPKIGSGND